MMMDIDDDDDDDDDGDGDGDDDSYDEYDEYDDVVSSFHLYTHMHTYMTIHAAVLVWQ